MQRTGRRPGISTTREQIVAAAAASFSSLGYDGTSMRQVATDAEVDPALVRRFRHQGTAVQRRCGGGVPAGAGRGHPAGRPPRQAGGAVDALVLGLLGDVESPGPLLGLVRSAATNEDAAGQTREFLAHDMLGSLTRELGVDHLELRAALAAAQLVGLIIARYAVKVDALVSSSPDELARWVAPTLQRYLTGRAPQP